MAQLHTPDSPRFTPRRRTQQEPANLVELTRATVTGLGSVGITIILILALLANAMLLAFGRTPPVVRVPDVLGEPAKTAQTRMEGAGLKLSVVNYDYNPNVKEGNIISISPYEGKKVREGREIKATVSRGSRTVKVPDLKGLSLDEATTKLNDLDLQIGQAPRQSHEEAADTILRQDPAPGTVLPRKARINLAVSGGPGYGRLELADGKSFVFRTVKVTVPQGKALQMVSINVEGEDMEKSFLDRLCRPGEVVTADLYGPERARVRVKIEDERVFSERLE